VTTFRNLNQWTSPLTEGRESPQKGSYGLFAKTAIPKGTVVLVWAGRLYTKETLPPLGTRERLHCVQVEDDIYLGPVGPPEPADFANHSCDPNVGVCGQIALVAMRDIGAGEELCFDYAMSDCTPYDEFDCGCGAPTCRRSITGEDWKRPELWERYRGFFAPHVQRKIDRLRAGS
jgi:hypothetical protein